MMMCINYIFTFIFFFIIFLLYKSVLNCSVEEDVNFECFKSLEIKKFVIIKYSL